MTITLGAAALLIVSGIVFCASIGIAAFKVGKLTAQHPGTAPLSPAKDKGSPVIWTKHGQYLVPKSRRTPKVNDELKQVEQELRG
mgnify:CR=1 FL=1